MGQSLRTLCGEDTGKIIGVFGAGVAVGVAVAALRRSQGAASQGSPAKAVLSTDLPGLKKIYQGKVRDIYEVDEDTVLQVATDRLSSFDVVMLNGIPGKGKILTQLSLWWFEHLSALPDGCPNHIITGDVDMMPQKVRVHKDVIDGRCMLVKKLKMLPVESIVRGYITGSGFKDYKSTGAVCGIELPKNLRDCEKLAGAIFTPSTKADLGSHDMNVSRVECAKCIGDEMTNALEKASLAYYSIARDFAAAKGIILADTKFEFGLDKDGTLILADEILTPDCSRFWDASKYEVGRQQDSLDKQFVRNYLLSINFDKTNPVEIPDDIVQKTMAKYVDCYRVITGQNPLL